MQQRIIFFSVFFFFGFIALALGASVKYVPNITNGPSNVQAWDPLHRHSQSAITWSNNSTEFLSVFIRSSVRDDTSEALATSVMAQRLNSLGEPLAAAFPIFAFDNEGGEGLKANPVIVHHNLLDEYLVAFEYDTSEDATNPEIYGVILRGNGTVRVAAFAISPANMTGMKISLAAYEQSPRPYDWVVAWEASSGDGSVIPLVCFSEDNTYHASITIGDDGDTLGDPFLYYNLESDIFLMVYTQLQLDGKTDLNTVELLPDADFGLVPDAPQKIYPVSEEDSSNPLMQHHVSSVSPSIIGSSPPLVVWQVNGKVQSYIAVGQIDSTGAPLSIFQSIGTDLNINVLPRTTWDSNRNQLNMVHESSASVDENGVLVNANVYLTVVDAVNLFILSQIQLNGPESQNNAHAPVIGFNGGTVVTLWVNGTVATPIRPSRLPYDSPPSTMIYAGVEVVEYITHTDNNDDDYTTLIVLIIIIVFFGVFILLIGSLILIIVIKYRRILRARVDEIREHGLPSLPRSDGFEQL